MDKDVYKIITDLWQFTKKYLPLCKSSSEEVWDGIRDDGNAIYKSTEGKPEYFREMTSKMIVAAITLLEGIYRENNNVRN